MTGVHDVALFVAAGLLLNVTPGPDMAYIAARSAAGGFRDGTAAVFGITAGCVAHTLAAARLCSDFHIISALPSKMRPAPMANSVSPTKTTFAAVMK